MTTLILSGPYTGRTIRLRGIQFIEGKARLLQEPEQIEGLITYMAKCYQAYPEGSSELRAAQERWREHLERSKHGQLQDGASAQPRPAGEVPRDVQPAGGGPGSPSPEVVRSDDAAQPGDPGVRPDGQERPGSAPPEAAGRPATPEAAPAREGHGPETATLIEAIQSLDPENDEVWTAGGQPTVAAVAGASGMPGVTRARITMAIPGFDRNKAREMRSGQEAAVGT